MADEEREAGSPAARLECDVCGGNHELVRCPALEDKVGFSALVKLLLGLVVYVVNLLANIGLIFEYIRTGQVQNFWETGTVLAMWLFTYFCSLCGQGCCRECCPMTPDSLTSTLDSKKCSHCCCCLAYFPVLGAFVWKFAYFKMCQNANTESATEN